VSATEGKVVATLLLFLLTEPFFNTTVGAELAEEASESLSTVRIPSFLTSESVSSLKGLAHGSTSFSTSVFASSSNGRVSSTSYSESLAESVEVESLTESIAAASLSSSAKDLALELLSLLSLDCNCS
jgi:hypothetical protein